MNSKEENIPVTNVFKELEEYERKGTTRNDKRFGDVTFFSKKNDPNQVIFCKEKIYNG